MAQTLKEKHDELVKRVGEAEAKRLLHHFYDSSLSVDSIAEIVLKNLNDLTKSKFRWNTRANKRIIIARLNEGFTQDDFLKVNLIMSKKWMGTEFQSYLRPITLYSTKFESYLAEHDRWKQNKDLEDAKAEEKRIESLAKENKAIRQNLKEWWSFETYQELWSYIAGMNEQEFLGYDLPEKLRDLQSKWLKMKFSKTAVFAMNTFQELKENRK